MESHMFPNTTQLSDAELKLIELIRELKWGEVTVIMKNGVPVMAQKVRMDVKLTK